MKLVFYPPRAEVEKMLTLEGPLCPITIEVPRAGAHKLGLEICRIVVEEPDDNYTLRVRMDSPPCSTTDTSTLQDGG